ncbi:MAG: glycoside hydrolase family 3 C-terminal domain-containing protein [Clostridia bacterium]|nr:glycoside hydrolase family 3 C-terminal domain-containing protein [Clostridia bacterium]
MDQNLKALKKACKRDKRKNVTLWKSLAIVSLVVAILMGLASFVLNTFDNTMSLFLNDKFWTLENEDPNAIYFESEYKTEEERVNAGYALVKQVEGEGAALLLNNNNALPLGKGAKVSLFSTSSVNLVYGGTGSANVDASKADTLKAALEGVGLEVNEALWNFYLTGPGSEYLRSVGGTVSLDAASVSEAPWSIYTEDVLGSVASYGDAAIVTLSRVGGEGADLEFQKPNYLALDQNEKDMMKNLADMKKAGTIKKIVVLINSSNPLQVDFLKENEYGIDACLWIGGVGITGINAVAEILEGSVNPSGSLVDIYCYDNFSSPAMQNFVPTTYEGYVEGLIPENASTYMIYQEGIYVGYKYYETRYEDYVMGTGNAGDYAYGDDVAFPFGYGLSYTTFAYSDMKMTYDAATTTYTIEVKVTNTGSVAGKEVVQIYVSSPYTDYDVKNGVEKASVSLVGFEKTDILQPGASEVLTIKVDGDDVASYDAYGAGTYILDAGDYYFTAATDSHNAANNVLAAKGFTPDSTANRMDVAGDATLVAKWNNPALDTETYAKSDNGTEIKNQLSNADINLNEGVKEKITYLTRNDWTGTMPTGDILKLTLTDMLKDALQDIQYDPADYEKIDMPTLGADNGLKLVDMIGLDYDDPKWDQLLDQLTFDEMVTFIGDAFHWTMPVESVQAPGTRDENGPQGLTVTLFGSGLGVEVTALTSEDVLAATFNKELVYEMGKIVGEDCLAANVAILYGPGANTHRTPYGGRNFEYYSEDGYLSSAIGAAEVRGIEEKGVHVVIKHFALNDSEQDRIGLGVWLNEQAAREIYLKAFQGALQDSQAGGNGVMMAYTRWGTQWSGANHGLVTGIMKNEWGCNGLQITDNVLTTYVNGVDGVMGGTTAFDSMLAFYITNLLPEYENDPVVVAAMKEACHQNLYAIAHSCGMNGIGPDTVITAKPLTAGVVCTVVAIVAAVLFIPLVVLWAIGKRKWKQGEAYTAYKAAKAERKQK